MATRLYPITTNHKILDALANVPKGTTKTLFDIKEKQQAESADLYIGFFSAIAAGSTGEEFRTAFSEMIKRNDAEMRNEPNLARADDFNLFGFGRISPDAASAIQDLNMEPSAGWWERETVTNLHGKENAESRLVEGTKIILTCQHIILPQGVKAEDLEGLAWN